MCKASILAVILVATLLANPVCSQVNEPPTQPNFFYEQCSVGSGNYTANSTYETNLKRVLSDLQTHASAELAPLFHNTSAGNGSDTVYGQYFCRADIDSVFCSQCILQAAQEVFRNCSGVKSGVIWYQECSLRYRNQSMFGIYESDANYSYGWTEVNVSDPVGFSVVLNDTMNTIIQEAAYGSSSSKLATKQGQVSLFQSVYCLVQCSPDLNGTQCDTCLQSAYGAMGACCGKWPNVVFVFFQSCEVMYSTRGAFYFTPNAPPPPPSLPNSEPPPSPFTVSQPPPSNTEPPPPPMTISQSSPSPNGSSTIVRSSQSVRLGIVTIITVVILMLVLDT